MQKCWKPDLHLMKRYIQITYKFCQTICKCYDVCAVCMRSVCNLCKFANSQFFFAFHVLSLSHSSRVAPKPSPAQHSLYTHTALNANIITQFSFIHVPHMYIWSVSVSVVFAYLLYSDDTLVCVCVCVFVVFLCDADTCDRKHLRNSSYHACVQYAFVIHFELLYRTPGEEKIINLSSHLAIASMVCRLLSTYMCQIPPRHQIRSTTLAPNKYLYFFSCLFGMVVIIIVREIRSYDFCTINHIIYWYIVHLSRYRSWPRRYFVRRDGCACGFVWGWYSVVCLASHYHRYAEANTQTHMTNFAYCGHKFKAGLSVWFFSSRRWCRFFRQIYWTRISVHGRGKLQMNTRQHTHTHTME